MKITAIGTNIVLKLNDRAQESRGGIALPSQYSQAETEGEVMSVGSRVADVKVGDLVGFPKHLGTLFTHQQDEFLILDESKALYVRGAA